MPPAAVAIFFGLHALQIMRMREIFCTPQSTLDTHQQLPTHHPHPALNSCTESRVDAIPSIGAGLRLCCSRTLIHNGGKPLLNLSLDTSSTPFSNTLQTVCVSVGRSSEVVRGDGARHARDRQETHRSV